MYRYCSVFALFIYSFDYSSLLHHFLMSDLIFHSFTANIVSGLLPGFFFYVLYHLFYIDNIWKPLYYDDFLVTFGRLLFLLPTSNIACYTNTVFVLQVIGDISLVSRRSLQAWFFILEIWRIDSIELIDAVVCLFSFQEDVLKQTNTENNL